MLEFTVFPERIRAGDAIGFAGGLCVAQLKILQEAITQWDYVRAALCLLGAVHFIFR